MGAQNHQAQNHSSKWWFGRKLLPFTDSTIFCPGLHGHPRAQQAPAQQEERALRSERRFPRARPAAAYVTSIPIPLARTQPCGCMSLLGRRDCGPAVSATAIIFSNGSISITVTKLWIFLYVLCNAAYSFLSVWYDPDMNLKGNVVWWDEQWSWTRGFLSCVTLHIWFSHCEPRSSCGEWRGKATWSVCVAGPHPHLSVSEGLQLFT